MPKNEETLSSLFEDYDRIKKKILVSLFNKAVPIIDIQKNNSFIGSVNTVGLLSLSGSQKIEFEIKKEGIEITVLRGEQISNLLGGYLTYIQDFFETDSKIYITKYDSIITLCFEIQGQLYSIVDHDELHKIFHTVDLQDFFKEAEKIYNKASYP